jgi:hypothetical protein
MPLRFWREVGLLVCVCLGAGLGYMAGRDLNSEWQLVCSFGGMAVFGAFADLCMNQRAK